jgi:signal transduction histidine kinase
MRKSDISKKLDIRRFLRYLTDTPDSSLNPPANLGQIHRVNILRFTSIIAIMTLILLGILALIQKNTFVGIVDLFLAFILIGNVLHGQQYKQYTFNIYLGISLAAMLFIYMFLTGGINRSGFVWFYTFPVVACFLLGSKKGAIATVLISLPVVILFLMKTPPSVLANYSLDFKFRFMFSFSVVFAFSYLFEYSREKNRQELQRARDDLEKRFDERTSALQALQEAIQSLQKEISERRRAEEALKEKTEELGRSNRDLEQFAYVASHDLQEPLRMVTSYVQLLAKRYKGKLDSDADEFISFALDGSLRMRKLINDLLTYSRVGTRKKELKPTNCKIVLDQSLNNLKVAIEENGVVVTHDPLPTVMVDNPQWVQLFQNLIGNAIKFRGNEPPRVHVSASPNGNGWIFSVRDNGIGIAPEYAESIFTIFKRLHGRQDYAGTGIGLAICKKIVERHGGRI